MFNEEMERAARYLYGKRDSRKTNPKGHFDKGGRWYPSSEERQPCCDNIRGPSRNHPYSYMVHCRTLKHCRQLVESAAQHD